MISGGYRTHGGVAGSMNFKKSGGFFFGKSCSRIFGAPGCYPSTLIDFTNTALASRRSVKPICRISEGYRTHRGVTGSMNFKKSGGFFFGKSCSRIFGVPGCHPITLINLVNTALANRDSVETICIIWEDCRTHTVVTGPMNFKKTGFFFGRSCSRIFGTTGCHPGTLFDPVNTGLDRRVFAKTMCMVSEGYRTHGDVAGLMNFKKSGGFFRKVVLPGFLGPLSAIQAL